MSFGELHLVNLNNNWRGVGESIKLFQDVDISFWKDIRLHITFSILRCHSQTRWSTVIIIHNSRPYRLGTLPWRDPTMYPKCNIQRHERSGFDLGIGWGYRKLPQHQDNLWAPTASRWGQAWRVREEPGPLQEQTRLAAWWGAQPLSLFTLVTWTALCCFSHWNNEGKGM